MSLLTPLGNTPKQFWDNLIMGKCALCTMDWEDKENYNCKVIAPIPDFPIKAELKDKCYAYQMADYLMSELLEEEKESNIEKNLSLILAESLPNWENLLYLDNIKNNEDLPFKSTAEWLADRYKLNGWLLTLGQGCISGTYGLGRALRAVRNNEIRDLLVGAIESLLHPFIYSLIDKGELLSNISNPKEASRPFDINRDKEITAEGGALFLASTKQNKETLGEIIGFAMTNEAWKFRKNKPDGYGLASAIKLALKDANSTPAEIDLVLAHATGFKGSDAIEINALKQIFTNSKKPPVVSIKGQTGQPMSVGGSWQIAVALLSLKHQIIPMTYNCIQSDPDDPFEHIHKPYSAKIEKILVISYGYGSTKTALIIQKS